MMEYIIANVKWIMFSVNRNLLSLSVFVDILFKISVCRGYF